MSTQTAVLPSPQSPPSLHILGRAATGVSSVATRAEPCHLVLVTGLVTGPMAEPSVRLPPPTVIRVHASAYTSTWSTHHQSEPRPHLAPIQKPPSDPEWRAQAVNASRQHRLENTQLRRCADGPGAAILGWNR
jgi:hypothetical protein